MCPLPADASRRSLPFAIALGCLALTTLTAFAQDAKPIMLPSPTAPAVDPQRSGIEDVLSSLRPDQASAVRAELSKSKSLRPELEALVDPFTKAWEWKSNLDPVSGTTVSFTRTAIDLEGNVILAGQSKDSNGNLNGVGIAKIDGSLNSNPSIYNVVLTGYINQIIGMTVDLDGNIYVTGFYGESGGVVWDPRVVKISPHGFIVWQMEYDMPGVQGYFGDLQTDADGVLFAAGEGYVYQINPVNGIVGWVTDLRSASECDILGADLRMLLALGKGGEVYVTNPATIEGQERGYVARLDGGTGQVLWCTEQPFEIGSHPVIDHSGNVYVAGTQEPFGVLVKFAPDGTRLFFQTYSVNPGQQIGFRWVRIGPDNQPVIGSSFFADGASFESPLVIKVNTTGNVVWATYLPGDGLAWTEPNPDFAEYVIALELDRLGNPYATSSLKSGANTRTGAVTKLDGTDGSLVWNDPQPLYDGHSIVIVADLVVDAGGNVFTTNIAAGGPLGTQSRVIKYTQPYEGVPTVQAASVSLSFEDQSLWAPGTGNLKAEQDLFEINWNEGIDEGGTFFTPLGDFGGSFKFITSGTLKTGVRAEIDGGTADVHLPFDVEYTIPPADTLIPGSTVVVDVEWTPDPAARLTSNFTPTFNAGLVAGVDYSIFSRANLVAFSEDLIDVTFVDEAGDAPAGFLPAKEMDYIPEMNLIDALSYGGFPPPGEWGSFDIPPAGLFTAEFRTPQMYAQGRYNPATNSFSTDASDRFFVFGVSVTEAILRPFGLTAQFDFAFPKGDDADFQLAGEGQVLQLVAKADIGARQQIDVGVVPMVRYEFSDGISSQTIPINQDLQFTLPNPFDGNVDIYPTVQSTANFNNETDIEMFPGIRWTTLEAGLSASAFGYNLLALGPYCFLCFDWDLAEILEALGVPNPTAVNMALNVFDDGWAIPFDEVELACMRVLGQTTTKPNLAAASRETLSMLIYDQTSPSVSSFNVTTGSPTNMLLYGERLNSSSIAMIEHWGRIEALPTTHVNDSTLLVSVPGRFRLLPGVAKVHVVSNGGASQSIDLAVTFPTPRLDAVNPNLWAADPDLATLPISVIDARSFAGNDTFIARRDYYIKMRDDLWSDITDGGFVGGADAYFPYFDFNRLPEFPSVLWGGAASAKPLPRFVQPVDNGIHNVRLAEDQYNRPQAVPVVICNPGPGGGMSNELTLTIAAPIPVASAIEPSSISPIDNVVNEFDENGVLSTSTEPIELRITGPRHVPHFSGYEEPKYGNFNADSVVRFNGVDLATTFISSSVMIAQLPPEMVVLGDHRITVFTPSNGTKYFEEKWVDANADGQPDDVPVFQGLLDSGGESAQMLFRIRYRQPSITEANPYRVAANAAAFDDTTYAPGTEPAYNLVLHGADFRSGCVAYFNGEIRDTAFIGDGLLYMKLLPEDVAVEGEFPITVQNGGPDFQWSESTVFEVFPAAGSDVRWGTGRTGTHGAVMKRMRQSEP